MTTGKDKVDIFCHVFPKRLVSSLDADQVPGFLVPDGHRETRHYIDPSYRLKVMDKYGIEVEALTVSLGTFWLKVPEKDALKVTRLANDSLMEVVEKNPERLVPISALPDLSNPEGLDELDRAIRDLGMKGCMVFSNVRGKPLDSPEFDDFFVRMARYDLPVLLHPLSWLYYPWIREYDLIQMFGWPFDTSLAMARLVFGGVIERHPTLKVICHHVGAMIPHFSERVRGMYDTASERKMSLNADQGVKAGPKSLAKDPMQYFKSFYADTVTNGGQSSLRCGHEFYGTDKTVFATDYPFGPENGERWTRNIIGNVEGLKLGRSEKEKIFSTNARRLLKLG